MNEEKVLTERDWMSSVAIFARKYQCPVVPARMTARNSWLYYWFGRLNSELRDITLFNELLNKRGATIRIEFGPPISPEALEGEAGAVAAALREHAAANVAGAWRPLESAVQPSTNPVREPM